jgi:pimeloyl-ACP methyl ester carboxylesterase
LLRWALVAAAAVLLGGCLPPPGISDGGPGDADGGGGCSEAAYADCGEVNYRDDLAAHPGCSTEGLTYAPAQITGYRCAAKEYVGTEDTSKPIVLLVHGNSDNVGSWEAYGNDTTCSTPKPDENAPMLAERLVAAGYRVYAVDMRADRVCQVDRCDCDDITICNFTNTMDHGWGVPIVMHFIQSVADAYPDRRISIVGHSFGVTVIRDALRRLHRNGYPVFSRLQDVVLASGGNHGVSSYCGYNCCGQCPHMRGTCACEMGNRDAFEPTCFSRPLSGPDGAWEAPCADGQTAFGCPDACGGNAVAYTTVVMEDMADGSQRDVCVSEASAELRGTANLTISLDSVDLTNYFFCGFLDNHFGSIRSGEGLDTIMRTLSD